MKMNFLISVLMALFLISINSGCAHTSQLTKETKTADINKDGTPDVTYYSDGEYVTRTELDTNYDGETDVIVHTKDGKFVSAEADTDYNGTMDKKFTDASAFAKWVNENNPDFQESLQRTGLQFDLIRF